MQGRPPGGAPALGPHCSGDAGQRAPRIRTAVAQRAFQLWCVLQLRFDLELESLTSVVPCAHHPAIEPLGGRGNGGGFDHGRGRRRAGRDGGGGARPGATMGAHAATRATTLCCHCQCTVTSNCVGQFPSGFRLFVPFGHAFRMGK